MTKILLADDQELVRDLIAALLRMEPDFQVETVSDFAGAMEALKSKGVYDLVLLDYMMPGMNGLAGFQQIRSAVPDTPVAILSGVAPRAVAEQALAEGAAGYLSKTMSTRSLVAAVRFMAAGEVYAPISLMSEPDTLHTILGEVQLTQRELDVLRGLCRSMTNKEIALELDVQEVTVKLHVKSLYRKIGARNRTHAAMIAREAGLG